MENKSLNTNKNIFRQHFGDGKNPASEDEVFNLLKTLSEESGKIYQNGGEFPGVRVVNEIKDPDSGTTKSVELDDGRVMDIDSPEYRALWDSGMLYGEDPQGNINVQENSANPELQRYSEINNQNLFRDSDWLNSYFSGTNGAIARGLGQSPDDLSTIPDDQKQAYGNYLGNLYRNDFFQRNPQEEGEDRGAYLDRVLANQPGQIRDFIYNNLPTSQQESDWNLFSRGLSANSFTNPIQSVTDNIQNDTDLSDYEKQQKLNNLRSNPSAVFDESLNVFAPLSIPGKVVRAATYGDGSITDALSGVQDTNSTVEQIVTDPLTYIGSSLLPKVGALSKLDKINDIKLAAEGADDVAHAGISLKNASSIFSRGKRANAIRTDIKNSERTLGNIYKDLDTKFSKLESSKPYPTKVQNSIRENPEDFLVSNLFNRDEIGLDYSTRRFLGRWGQPSQSRIDEKVTKAFNKAYPKGLDKSKEGDYLLYSDNVPTGSGRTTNTFSIGDTKTTEKGWTASNMDLVQNPEASPIFRKAASNFTKYIPSQRVKSSANELKEYNDLIKQGIIEESNILSNQRKLNTLGSTRLKRFAGASALTVPVANRLFDRISGYQSDDNAYEDNGAIDLQDSPTQDSIFIRQEDNYNPDNF